MQCLVFGLSNGKFSMGSAIQVGLVAALSCIPYLFSTQYRAYVTTQFELQLKTLSEKEDVLKSEIQKLGIYRAELESYEKQKQKIRIVSRSSNSYWKRGQLL